MRILVEKKIAPAPLPAGIRCCLIFVFCIFLVRPAGALAQSSRPYGILEGRVIDSQSGEPVSFAEVVVVGLGRGDMADKAGRFSISHLPPGGYTLLARRQGYKSRRLQDVQIKAGDRARLDIELEPTVLSLDELVITASRFVELQHTVPQVVSVVSRRRIRDRQAVQTPEVLREEAGIFVQKTNQGGGSPTLRGLRANKVLLLIDGIRMNNATYRGGNLQYLNTVDPFVLERIEVVHGPVSVLYGSDALGGVIHLMTREPRMGGRGVRFSGVVNTAFSTADRNRSLHVGLEGGGRNWGLLLSGSYRKFGDITRGTRGGEVLMQRLRNDTRRPHWLPKVQRPNRYEARDLTAKFKWKLHPALEWSLVYQLDRQPSVPRYDVHEVGKYEQWNYEPQERDLAYSHLRWQAANPFFHQARLTLSWHRQYERRLRRKPLSSWQIRDDFRTNTFGLQLQFSRLLGKNQLFVYGAEAYFDRVSSLSFDRYIYTGETRPRAPIFPDDSQFNRFGIYSQLELRPHRRWKVDAGARWSTFRLTAPFAADDAVIAQLGALHHASGAVTFSLGTLWELRQDLSLVANVAQGFRAPNLDDISKFGPGKGGAFYDVPNPALQPEHNLSFDVGVKMQSSHARLQAAFFYSHLSDLMIRRPAEFFGKQFIVEGEDSLRVFRKENAGRAYTTGFTVNFERSLGQNWLLRGWLGYTYGQDLTHDEPLSAIPPLNGGAALRWRGAKIWGEFLLRFAAEQNRLSPEDEEDLRIPEGGTPGWRTFNLRFGSELTEKLSLRGGVMNLLDENYREHLSGFNAPGRSYALQIEFRW